MGVLWASHYLPHDAEQKRQKKQDTPNDFALTSPVMILRELRPSWDFKIVPRVQNLQHGIDQTRQWGKFLGIAEHGKSSDDMELDGRQVLLRPGKVVVRARLDGKSDQDRIIDTAGLGRDEIAAATRGAFRELDRIAPLEAQQPAAPAPQPEAPKAKAAEPVKSAPPTSPRVLINRLGPDGLTDAERAAGKPSYADPLPKPTATAADPTIENIRDKAAVLRGVPKDSPPSVEGISLKWDDKENGFIFSRKHVDKVREAVGLEKPAAPVLDPYPALTVKQLYGSGEQTLYNVLPNGFRAVVDETGTKISNAEGKVLRSDTRNYRRDEIVAYAESKAPKSREPIGKNARGNDVFEDENGVRSYVDGGVRVTEPITLQPRRDGSIASSFNSSDRSSDFKTEAERNPAPTAAEVKSAAAEANRTPTDAQKEAGNYQMGHIMWNGLDITIETAKGAVRSGTDSDGEAWSVKIPAHYGYIKQTQGADGDHIDIYIGPNPQSSSVFVVDQMDAATGAFDEHKVMLGFDTIEAAQVAYIAGFSDGKGKDRMGSVTPMTVDQFKAAIADKAVWDKPFAKLEAPVKQSEPAKPAGLKGLSDAENAKMAELQARFKAKINSQINSGLDPELVTIAVQMGALYVKSGVRRFRALVDSMMNDMGLTLEQAQPYARNAYNQIRGDMELEGEDIADMDSDADVIAEVRKMRVAEAKAKADAAPSPEPAKSAKIAPEPTEGAKNDLATNASVSGASTGKSQIAEREGAAGGRVGGQGRAETDAGKPSAERDAGVGPERRSDAERADLRRRTGGTDGEVSPPSPQNHIIQYGDLEVKAGEKTRAKNSIEAIRVLRTLESEGRPATDEERQKLALYGGAGTLAAALPRSDGTIRFADLAAELDKLLEDEEKRTLSRTSQYAFYTSETTLRSMWNLAQRLGFKGGRIYEPGMGVGGFAGTMPEALRDVLYRSVVALRDILEKGILVSSEPDNRNRQQIKAVHKIMATVILDGLSHDLIATVREKYDGTVHYDISRAVNDGAKQSRNAGSEAAASVSGRPSLPVRLALEGSPVELNLDFAAPEINAAQSAVPVASLRDISEALAVEMKASGLEGKVTPALVRGLLGRAGVPIQGRQVGAKIEINAAAADPVGVLRHEIVHALRDSDLWAKPYGLFTREEWRALVDEARKDADLMARIKDAYDDLSETGQLEEAVAEMYREWAKSRSVSGTATRAFNKIATFFRALAFALRGEGFTDAALIMERIASGQIGGRGPDGSGPGRGAAEMRPQLLKAREKFNGLVGSRHWKNPGAYVSNLVTDAMAGKGDYSALALVPGRALFSELGKKFKAANAYLRSKEEMDALRNDWHARADKVAQRWLALRNKMPDVNDGFMDLMHRSTLAGISSATQWLQKWNG